MPPGSRSRCRRSRQTTVLNFSRRSTSTCSIAGSSIATSSRPLRGWTARWKDPTRIDAEEFYRVLDGAMIDDTKLFNDKLAEWENFYNYHRPNGGLGGQTPYERLRQKTQTPVK